MPERKLWYIQKRINPQFEKPYYTAMGQLNKRAVARYEEAIYGTNIMLPFQSEEEYNNYLEGLRSQGYHVYNR